MRIAIPTPLHSYTAQRGVVEASGASLADLLGDLDRQFPGIRFRMVDEQGRLRPHIRIFVDRQETRNLATPLRGQEEIHVFQALSGG